MVFNHSVFAYASNSFFIFINSSLVIVPSPSPNFCNFSLEESKSGRGGAGGIFKFKLNTK